MMNLLRRNRDNQPTTSPRTNGRPARRHVRTVLALLAALLLGGVLFGGAGANAASALLSVFVTNDNAHPVPTTAVGTTAVTGSVTVTNQPSAPPLWQGEPFTKSTILVNVGSYQCTDTAAMAIPAGKVLFVTRVVTDFNVPPGATGFAMVQYVPVGSSSNISPVSIPTSPNAPTRQVAGHYDTYTGALEIGQPVTSISACYASGETKDLAATFSVIGYLVPAP